MWKQLVVVWIVLAAALAITAAVVPSVEIDGGVLSLLAVALLFGLVNALIGPFLRLVALPFGPATLGLVGLVVNGVLLAITAGLTDALDVGGFLATVLAAMLISAVTALVMLLVLRVSEPHPE
jgi:putative membrane protein